MLNIKIKKYITIVCGIIVLYSCAGISLYASNKYVAVGYYNNYPYEFLNSEGEPSGFTVELFALITGKAGIDSELLLLPPDRMAHILSEGESDIIIGGVDSEAYDNYSFAGAVLEIPFSFAVHRDSLISDFRDLRARKIVITGHEIFSDHISDIIRKGYQAEPIYINNPDTAIMLLLSKGCDAVIIHDTKLQEILSNLSHYPVYKTDIHPGRFRYGYFVRKGNNKLMNDVKRGLSLAYAGGDYGRVYSRWFNTSGKYEALSKGFLLAWFLVGAVVFVFFMFANRYILGKRVNEKTAELKDTINILKKAETELQNEEWKFRKVFNKSPSGILILDSSGRILHYNEEIIKIFGLIEPDEIMGLDVIESPHSTEWFKTRIKKYRSVSIEFKYDFNLIKSTGFYKTERDGEIILEATIFPFITQTGEVEPGFICHVRDVTQNRTLLQDRNETARRYEVIFDSIRDGLWEWRLQDDSLRINRQFVNLLGYRGEHLPETFNGLCNLIHPDDKKEICGIIRERIASGRSFTVEYRILKNDGSWLFCRSRGDVVEWNHELQPVTVIATHTDISRVILSEKTKPDELMMAEETFNRIDKKVQGESFDGRKALIVDDNCLITLHLEDMLARVGFLCVKAISGFEAIEIVKKDNQFDVVLLDLEMPELDGLTTMKLLKKIKNDITIIANTGHCDTGCAEVLLSSGFDDIVSKPVQELILLEKIEKLLNSTKQIHVE